MEKLRGEIVPRAENAEHWGGQTREIANLQRKIDDLNRFQSGLISAPDYLKTLDTRLRQVEMREGARAPP